MLNTDSIERMLIFCPVLRELCIRDGILDTGSGPLIMTIICQIILFNCQLYDIKNSAYYPDNKNVTRKNKPHI